MATKLTAEQEKKLAYTMKTLGMTRQEVLEMWEEDKEIDRGAKLFELDPELEAGAKKARQADRKKSDTPVKRERKEDTDKTEILQALMDGVSHLAESLEKTKNGEFEFTFNGRKFKVVLSAPRK